MAKARARRKSDSEARVERLTWFLLVAVFAIVYYVPGEFFTNKGFVPLLGAIILLGSGVYQYTRHWRVSPITWISGSIMLLFAIYNFTIDPTRDFLGLALLTFAGVILFGLLTGET
jgi:uncharacterized membrane protein YjjP (DUF1212 family)